MRRPVWLVALFAPVVGFWLTAGWSTARADLRVATLLTVVVVCAALISAGLLRPFSMVGAAAIVLVSVGGGWQARVAGGDVMAGAVPVFAVVVGLLAGVLGAQLIVEAMERGRALAIGLALCGVAIGFRILPAVAGNAETGAISLAGHSLAIGEVVRVLFVAGTACLLADSAQIVSAMLRGAVPWRSRLRWVSWVWGPSILVLLAMLAFGDAGPAMVLSAALAAMMYRALGPRYALVPLSLGIIGFVLAAPRSEALVSRWRDLRDPSGHGADQLGRALRAMGDGGLLGSGSRSLAPSIPAATSDYVPAAVGATAGLLTLAVVLVIAFVLPLAILRGAARTAEGRGVLSTGMATLLLVPALWTGLGNLGLIPFSGIDVPFLGANGMSSVASGMALGAAVVAIGVDQPRWEMLTPGSHILKLSVVVVGVSVVALCAQSLHLAMTGGPPLVGESYMRVRGAVASVDGRVLAQASPATLPRTYSDSLFVALGWASPGLRSTTGFERLATGATTCATHRGPWARGLSLGLAKECKPADVTVLTVDARYQALATEAAKGTGSALIVVADVHSGGVLAAASSSLVPSSQLADLTSGSHSRAKAVDDMDLPAFDTEPFTRHLAPGSTFKMVTGAAAEINGVAAPSGLGASYEPEPGTRIENVWRGPCPGSSTEKMIGDSCNTVAAFQAVHVGESALAGTARAFGFDAPVAFIGPAYRPLGDSLQTWQPATASLGVTEASTVSDLARTGIGQSGVLATPWDIAYATSIIASEGEVRSPTMISGTCSGASYTEWTAESRVGAETRAETASSTTEAFKMATAVVYEGMLDAVRSGTASELRTVLPGQEVAAKTGTADVLLDGKSATISWITLIISRETVVTVAVLPTSEHLRPHAEDGRRAIDVAANLLPRLPERVGPSCPNE